MTQNDIIRFASSLPGVVAETASEATGATEIAWGDTFIFRDPIGDAAPDRRFPFATIVTRDYGEFDMASDLDRSGVFRLNLYVGHAAFEQLIGYPAAAHADHKEEWNYATMDRLLPHPVYAAQGWVSILNPGESTAEQAKALLVDSHIRAARRHGSHR